MNKKKLVSLCLVLALAITAAIGGTMAYFTDKEDVSNTFTVGKVYIELDETLVDDKGVPVPDADRTPDGNTYKLYPGHTYTKDPMVTLNAGSEESYIRMFVTINEQRDLDKLFPDAGFEPFFKGYKGDIWVYNGHTADATKDTRTYEFRYYKTIANLTDKDVELEKLFTELMIPATLTNEDIASLEGLKIDVVAQAIQADGFNTADAAWAAFPAE